MYSSSKALCVVCVRASVCTVVNLTAWCFDFSSTKVCIFVFVNKIITSGWAPKRCFLELGQWMYLCYRTSGAGAGEENKGTLRPAQGGHDAEGGPAGGQSLQHVQSGAGQVPVGISTHVWAHRTPSDGRRWKHSLVPVLCLQCRQGIDNPSCPLQLSHTDRSDLVVTCPTALSEIPGSNSTAGSFCVFVTKSTAVHSLIWHGLLTPYCSAYIESASYRPQMLKWVSMRSLRGPEYQWVSKMRK